MAQSLIPLWWWFTFAISFCISAPLTPNSGLFDSPEIFLTISAEAGYTISGKTQTLSDRRIILNWNKLSIVSGSFVGLFKTDPGKLLQSNSLLESEALDVFHEPGTTGSHRTSVQYRKKVSAKDSSSCVGYWIAHVQNGTKILQQNCLRIYPRWMHEIKGSIEDRPLHAIMIPGTHNAGSWKRYNGKPSDSVLISYVICQEDSIYEQLVHGIRFLDLRVAYYPFTEEKFWINHDVFRVRPLNEVLTDVKQFVEETQEIVIVDFHNFPVGFDGSSEEKLKIHEKLISLVEEKLGEHLAPKSLTKEVTPKQLWGGNKTVILGYGDSAIVERHPNIWKNVRHAWADTNEVGKLQSYLGKSHQDIGCKGQYWSAMAELTATFDDIIGKPNVGIRGFANSTNPAVTNWYRQKDWYSRAMIIATDFYLGNNLIEMSIKANTNKVVCNF